jgi:hypothetical protein
MSPHYRKVSAGCAGFGPKKIRRPPGRLTDLNYLLRSKPDILLVGLNGHCPNTEAERDADDDRKNRNPHGVPPLAE